VSQILVQLVTPVGVLSTIGTSTPFPIGTSTVIYTAFDRQGHPSTPAQRNSASCNITVTVTDRQAPSITCPPTVNGTTDNGTMYATIAGGGVTIAGVAGLATDNSDQAYGGPGAGIASVTRHLIVHRRFAADDPPVVLTNTTQLPIGTQTVVYTAFDQQGNNVSCSISVSISDVSAPVINRNSCVNTVGLTNPNAHYGTTDPCNWVQNIYGSETAMAAACAAASTSGYTCTFSPASNSTLASCANAAFTGGVVLPTIAATDNSGVAKVRIVPRLADGTPVTAATQFPIGQTVLFFMAVDQGTPPNMDVCNLTLTVVDTQPPNIVCPSNITNAVTNPGPTCSSGCSQQAYATMAARGIVDFVQRSQLLGNNAAGSIATDNSDTHYGSAGSGVANVLVQLVTAGGMASVGLTTPFPVGYNLVRLTAVDQHSNNASCFMSVTVSDIHNPVINRSTCSDVVASADPNSFASTITTNVMLPTLVASDNHALTVQRNVTSRHFSSFMNSTGGLIIVNGGLQVTNSTLFTLGDTEVRKATLAGD
jgi:hypothetical protein